MDAAVVPAADVEGGGPGTSGGRRAAGSGQGGVGVGAVLGGLPRRRLQLGRGRVRLEDVRDACGHVIDGDVVPLYHVLTKKMPTYCKEGSGGGYGGFGYRD